MSCLYSIAWDGMHNRSLVTPDAVTLKDFGQTYLARRGTPATKNDTACLGRLTAFALPGPNGEYDFGDKPLGAVTEDDVEAFFVCLRRKGRAASTLNKYVQLVKAMFRWAVKKGYLSRNPIAESDTIRREQMARRSRRLAPDVFNEKGDLERAGEERRLLTVASPLLHRLIIGALETGCRRGELLNLAWRDVNLTRKELTVRAELAKSRKQRILPVSARLAAVLEMARTDPASQQFPPEANVFGDAVGRKVISIKRAWETAVLKAHGYTPAWTSSNKLSATSRAALRAINLHFHDLRHEAGSRLLEQGWPLHHVQEMLGHANVSQTSTYLNATRIGLQDSMRRFDEAGSRCNPVAIELATEHPPDCNADSPSADNSLVN